MATDALIALQASVTKTATFNGAAFDLATRPPLGMNLWVRVLFSAATNASGSNSVTFTVDGSSNGTNFTPIGGADYTAIVNLSTTAQSGEIFIPVNGFSRYIRLSATFAGAGSTPTITYQGDLSVGAPS